MIEQQIKHLEMLEAVIQRMVDNSFKLKEWTVALISVLGVLSSQGTDKRFMLIVFLPLFAFWGLDAFYLQLERKYRILYKNVISNHASEFCMDTRSIVATGNDLKGICFFNCLFSKTELVFYATIGVVMGGLMHFLSVF